MTCSDFERFWSTHSSGELPSEAHAHLSSCPRCGALVQADNATDALLREFRAARFAAPIDLPRDAIDLALAGHSVPRRWTGWRRPLILTAAGLAAAAVVVGLIERAPRNGPASAPPRVAKSPPLQPGGPSHVPGIAVPSGPHPGGPHEPRVGWVTPPSGPQWGSGGRTSLIQPHSSAKSAPWISANVPVRPAPAREGTRPDNDHGERSSPGSGVQTARNGAVGSDLLRLNDGRLATASPYSAPVEPLPRLQPLPLVEARKPGSVVLDDLLNLNPVRVAALGNVGLSAAAQTLASEAPTTDARLQQKVFVHATMEKLSDLLAWLSKATGVTLVPRMEVASEPVSLWADDRTLMDVMRDLRHLHGYFWSRAKRGGQYVYSLWQDAQSRAQEEAETQRYAAQQQREFENSVWKHVRALNADEAEMKRLAREDPYLVAQMKHPVMRAAYRLFAMLAPDQQAWLLRGQTPSRDLLPHEALRIFPLAPYVVPDRLMIPVPDDVGNMSPQGDVVTLGPQDLTAAQRAVVVAILQGAMIQAEREGQDRGVIGPLKAALPDTARVSLFRWGDALYQGLSLRVEVQSGNTPWAVYSCFAAPPFYQRFFGDLLRRGQFYTWKGAQEDVDRYLGDHRKRSPASPPVPTLPAAEKPDPILDAPVSLAWTLLPRGGQSKLTGLELIGMLYRKIGRPLVMDGQPGMLQQPAATPEFRWTNRPLRELLHRLFPDMEVHTSGGTIFLTDPERILPLHAVPASIELFLRRRQGPFTLEDLAFLARSLTPWQIVKLSDYLPAQSIDQMLAAYELLKLYGELSPAQQTSLAQGLPFTAMTPTQQALFVRFAQRQRPYVEPWRFQDGELRLSARLLTGGDIPTSPRDQAHPVASAIMDVQFCSDDRESFPVDLYPKQEHRWNQPLSDLVGQPFPFPEDSRLPLSPEERDSLAGLALADPRLQKKPLVIFISWVFASPYAGTHPPPAADTWTRRLADRLRDSGVTVAHVAIGGRSRKEGDRDDQRVANLIERTDPGDMNGQPLDSAGGHWFLFQSPTVFVVGSDEIVHAVFQGQEAWDAAAVEREARSLTRAGEAR